MFNPINIFLQLVQWFIGHLFIGLFQSSEFNTIAIALVESHSIGRAERSRSVFKVSVFSVFPLQKNQWFIGHLFIGLFQSSEFSTIAIALVESHSIGYAERSRSVSKVSVFSAFPWQKNTGS